LVGNVLEFADALSRPYYAGNVAKDVLEEENVARWRYRQLIRWFSKNFVLLFNNSYVNPWYLVRMSITQFAATLCAYMETWKMKGIETKGCTPKKFRLAVFNHLRRQWVGLIPKFDELSDDKPSPTFAWNGPEFQVIRRNTLPEEVLSSELLDLENYRITVADHEVEVPSTEKDSESDLTDIESEKGADVESEKEERTEAGNVEQDPDGEEERPETDNGQPEMQVDEEANAGSKQKSSEKPTQSKPRSRGRSFGE
jgi:hypothetical protein